MGWGGLLKKKLHIQAYRISRVCPGRTSLKAEGERKEGDMGPSLVGRSTDVCLCKDALPWPSLNDFQRGDRNRALVWRVQHAKFSLGRVPVIMWLPPPHPQAVSHGRHRIGLGVPRRRNVPVFSFVCWGHMKRLSHVWKRRKEENIFKGWFC